MGGGAEEGGVGVSEKGYGKLIPVLVDLFHVNPYI